MRMRQQEPKASTWYRCNVFCLWLHLAMFNHGGCGKTDCNTRWRCSNKGQKVKSRNVDEQTRKHSVCSDYCLGCIFHFGKQRTKAGYAIHALLHIAMSYGHLRDAGAYRLRWCRRLWRMICVSLFFFTAKGANSSRTNVPHIVYGDLTINSIYVLMLAASRQIICHK